jgi:hypothetical protein
MEIQYTIDAFATLHSLVDYIESLNTSGAGLRWLNRFENFITTKLSYPSALPKCNNKTFLHLGLHCLQYNDWIIAFTNHKSHIIIEAILHKTRLTD